MPLRLTSLFLLPFCAAWGETHWAYLPPVAEEIPAASHPVDALLGRSWKQAGILPAPPTAPGQWLKRAAYTLTGLPPTAQELRAFEAAHRNPEGGERAYAAAIESLIASPAYGERWARHWMDVARYADTQGYNFDRDNRYPHAYTYRDWLIRAFNNDLPYDQFVKLQIAADLIVDSPDHPDLAALGLLTVGPRAGEVETNDDRVDVITRGFLSTTVSCARCHDHKTDPLTQEDYYSFYSILENTEETQPVIGKAADHAASAGFEEEKRKLEEQDRAVRQAMIDAMRSRETLANYLELAWRAKKEQWDHGRASAEGFKKGRYRPTAILHWREFLDQVAWNGNPVPRLGQWAAAMEQAADKSKPCSQLAGEWIAALPNAGKLAELARDGRCPLSYDLQRIDGIFDQEDKNLQRDRDAAMTLLETTHPGSPPRAMAVRDRAKLAHATIYRRGDPSDRGNPFPRHWIGILGGEPYPGDQSPRLAMANRIADRANPLTARVIVNRVWGWHFGTPLADPGDFGPQQPAPAELALLDYLAVWFMDHQWSLKELHRLLLTSQAFRLSADGPPENNRLDEANSRFWKWNRRRLDFETMRDHLLATAGVLRSEPVGGRSVNLLSPDSDPRRSVYGFMDRHALPGLLVNFDVPHPDHHAPKRLDTIVPQQALYFLNNDLPIRHANHLASDPAFKGLPDDAARVHWIHQRLYRRPPTGQESTEALQWIREAAAQDYAPQLTGCWEIRHQAESPAGNAPLEPFPLIKDNVWRTADDLATAPIPFLHAGPRGGHTARTHALVLRWKALGAGEVRMTGRISRSQKGGDTLAWHLAGPDGSKLGGADFPPESEASLDAPWVKVVPGDTLDLVLRAPHGETCGGVKWDLRILGREGPGDRVSEISSLADHFPLTNDSPPLPPSGDPWADLIQVLWASNEFHFID